ncbi:MAG: glutaredoxin, partial [Solobacterium sp.]|nr:glutaredoxin [Solobacterium sp.]
GIPTLVLEDGTIRFDYEEWLKEEKISKADVVKSGQSCNIDGTGC